MDPKETEVKPVETKPTEVSPVETPTGVTPPTEVEVKPTTAPVEATPTEVKPAVAAPEPVKPKRDWRDARIAELTAKLNEEKAKRSVAPQAPTESDTDFNNRVEARAQEIARETSAVNDFARQCNEMAQGARTAHADFNDRFAQIRSVVNSQDPEEVRAYNSVLSAAYETGNGSEVLYDLFSDPGQFRELMKLSPTKLAMDIGTRAAKLGTAPEPSSAPKPITPINSSGVHYEGIDPSDPSRSDKLPKDAWFKLREAQARERGLQ